MALGLSFGSKKSTTDQTSTVNKLEATNQSQTGSTATTGTTNQSSAQQSAGTSQGQQATSQTGANKTTGTSVGQTQTKTSAFSDSVLGSIESAVQSLFGSSGAAAPVSDFNAQEFIDSGVRGATAKSDEGLQSNINQLMHGVGGSTGSNSMASLLANRMRNDAAAEMAGVKSTLTGQAEQIQRDNLLAQNQLKATDQGFLGNLLAALKGGTVTTTGQESTTQAQDQQTQTTGTANTAEQTSQQQTAQQTQTQQLLEMVNQLLQGTVATTGTEHTVGTTKSGGFGISAGL